MSLENAACAELDACRNLEEAPAGLGVQAGAAVPEAAADPQEAFEAVCRALTANHANTLALLSCLRACDVDEPRPYREVERELEGEGSLRLSMQTPHVLLGLLVKAGGIERIDACESAAASDDADQPVAQDPQPAEPAADLAAVPAGVEPLDDDAEAPEPSAAELPAAASSTQPVDYLLRTTPAGMQALAEFDTTARFERLIAAEPEGYLDAYLGVLNACEDEAGAKLPAIEAALKDMPALVVPKRIYPSYFVSKLETVGAISWDGAWRITAEGDAMLQALSASAA